jgi:hypothetical protein
MSMAQVIWMAAEFYLEWFNERALQGCAKLYYSSLKFTEAVWLCGANPELSGHSPKLSGMFRDNLGRIRLSKYLWGSFGNSELSRYLFGSPALSGSLQSSLGPGISDAMWGLSGAP